VDESTHVFDYEKLLEVTKVVTENLNKIIDMNFYPTDKTKVSNNKHRPIGIGVQGLADAFFKMDIAFGSELSKDVNKKIFETIYFAACTMSCELAIERRESIGKTGTGKWNTMGAYSSFVGSPMSKGKFQFDLWGVKPDTQRYDWNGLRKKIMKHGMMNSLLLAPMPTASTAQILGNNECFEPITSNLYSRRTLAGEFIVVNKYLMNELVRDGVWNEEVKNNIIVNKGSIQNIEGLSEHIKNKYKIVWEMKMKDVIDMAADRGKYICQSQSMNLWVSDPNYGSLTSMHFYAWKKGLKTGMYYLRRKAAHQAQQFTVDPTRKEGGGDVVENEEPCEMCSA
jgi:ribonucleotide reductase alpha subunit